MVRHVRGTMWVIGVLTLLCIASTFDKMVPNVDSPRPYLTDLPTFQAAAAAQANDENPYDHAVLVRNVTVSHDRFRIYPYVYTPMMAMALRPVAFISLDRLQTIWLFLLSMSAAVFVALALLLLREPSFAGESVAAWMKGRTPLQEVVLAIGILLMMPFYTSFMNGQIEAITAMGITGALFLLAKGRTVPAGILFASVLVTKHAAVVLVLYFVARGEWRFIITTAVAAVFFILLSMSIIGIGPWLDFLHFVRTLDATTAAAWHLSVDTAYNLSIPGMLARNGWTSADHAMKFLPLCSMLVLAGLTFFKRRWIAAGMSSLVFTAYALTASLIMPFMWSHHILYALPGIAAILCMPVASRKGWGWTFGIWIGVGLILQLSPGMLPDRIVGKLFDVRVPEAIFSTMNTIGMAGLVFICIIVARRQRTSTTTLPS